MSNDMANPTPKHYKSKYLVLPGRMEGSHSGLVRLLGEQLCPKGHREFESRPFRSAGQTQFMYYVYFLFLNNDKVYTGTTDNLRRRVAEHKCGKVKFTKYLKPFSFIGYEAFLLKSDAMRREKFLKTTEGKRLFRQQYRDILMRVRPIIRSQSSDGIVLSNDGTIGRHVE